MWCLLNANRIVMSIKTARRNALESDFCSASEVIRRSSFQLMMKHIFSTNSKILFRRLTFHVGPFQVVMLNSSDLVD